MGGTPIGGKAGRFAVLAKGQTVTLMAFVVLVVIAGCGGDEEAGLKSGAPKSENQQISIEADRLASKVALRWDPRQANRGRTWEREGRELGSSLIEFCRLEHLFWNPAVGHAASPLVGKGEDTFLALVGIFETRGAAAEVYRSLGTSNQRACYAELVRGLFVRQIGTKRVTQPEVDVGQSRLAAANALGVEVRTELHYPQGSYRGDHYPARDLHSDARLGLLRQGRVIYLVSSFRWGRFDPAPLAVFSKLLPR